jgi:hypothetical protein
MVYKRKDEIAKEHQEGEETKGEDKPQRGKSQGRTNQKRKYPEHDNEEPTKFTSAFEEYRAGYWRRPKKEKIYVTLETVIPPLPKNPLEAPDETQYHKQQAELDEKIDVLTKKIKDLAERFNERL